MSNPLVSIIIPTYNGSKYLAQTIESALNQTFKNIEIIVVDDGSTEDIKRVVNPFIDKICFIRQENSGPAAARIRGVEESKGEFISFLDHDDLWAFDKIERQVALFKNDSCCGLVYCYPCLIDQKGQRIPNEAPSLFPTGDVFEDFLQRNRITTFSATMIKRSAYNTVGGLDANAKLITCDDYDLWLKIAAQFRVLFSPGELAFYRIHPDNLVKNYELNLNAHLQVIEKCQRNILINFNSFKKKRCKKFINENLFATYRKFAFIFYYKHQAEANILSRKFFKKALVFQPINWECLFYYCMTFLPCVILRKILRKIIDND